MPAQAATSVHSAATSATRALRARRTRLSYHLRGTALPSLSGCHYGLRKLIESKAWGKTRRIFGKPGILRHMSSRPRSPEDERVRRYAVGGHAFDAPRLPAGLYAVA